MGIRGIRASVSAEMAAAVVGVYTIPIGRSDHEGVVLQLNPEEDTGMSRRTIAVEIIRMEEFQKAMQQELVRIEALQGDKWWEQVEELAHMIGAEVKGKRKDWTNSMWQVEEALSNSSIRRLTGAAKKVLAEEGIAYEDTKQAYRPLCKVVSKRRKSRRKQQLIGRVKEAMQEEREGGQEDSQGFERMQQKRETSCCSK